MTRLKMKRNAVMLPSAKPWQPADQLSLQPIHSIASTALQIDSMTLKEVEEHCTSWRMENTWKLAREVSDRIHDEPGPGKHDFLISVSSYSKKQQILHFLTRYLIQGKKAPSSKRSKMCGNVLFLKRQKSKEDHVRQGHYLKFACEPNCESCKQEGWSAGVPGN